jgi:hypothetical protein
MNEDGCFVGFDVIIGNPPYISVKDISKKNKLIFSNSFKTAVGQFDLYGLFLEKSIALLKQNAVSSFITSNTFLNNKDFLSLRKFLLENSNIYTIANLDETVFETAQVDVAITILKKSTPSETNKIKVYRSKSNLLNQEYDLILQKKYNNEQNLFEIKLNCTEKDFNIIEKIYQNKILLHLIMDLPRGIEIGSNSNLIMTENARNLNKLLVGKDISKYEISFKNRFIEFNGQDKPSFKDISIYKSEKILIQRIRNLSLKQRLVCTYDNNGYLCTNTLRIGLLKTNKFSLKFILGTLNSKLINYLFLKYFLNKDIYAYQLEQIPIPNISNEQQQPIIDIVDKILSAKNVGADNYPYLQADTSDLEKQIDELVYGLYGLTEGEVRVVEGEK